MIHSTMDLTSGAAVSGTQEETSPALNQESATSQPAANEPQCCGLSEKKRQRALLLAMNFLCGAITMLMPVLAIKHIKHYRPEIHFFNLGGIFVTYYVANTITSLYVTSRIKKWHTQKLYLAGLALQSLSLLLFGFASKLHSDAAFLCVIYFQRVMEAVACSLINGCGQTMLLNLFPSKNMRNMSWFDIAFSAGTFLGPYLIEYLYEMGSLLAAYVFMGSLQFALCFVAELVLRVIMFKQSSSGEDTDTVAKRSQPSTSESGNGCSIESGSGRNSESCNENRDRVTLCQLIRIPAFWLVLLPSMGTNAACTVVDVGLGSYLSDMTNDTDDASSFREVLSSYSLQFIYDATPFFSANLCFFLCSMNVGIFAKKFEKHRLAMMLSGVLMAGLGCAIMGMWPTYWSFCIGMALIGGGFAPPMTCASVTIICIGRNLGMSDKDLNSAAPHIIDTASAFSKAVGYIAAAVLIRQLEYPTSSLWFGIVILAMSGCFASSFLPANSKWMSRRVEVKPQSLGELQLAENNVNV